MDHPPRWSTNHEGGGNHSLVERRMSARDEQEEGHVYRTRRIATIHKDGADQPGAIRRVAKGDLRTGRQRICLSPSAKPNRCRNIAAEPDLVQTCPQVNGVGFVASQTGRNRTV